MALLTAALLAFNAGALGHWLSLPVALLALGGYFVTSWVRQGQTLAMSAWRLQLVRADGARLDPGSALRRFVIALLLIGGMPLIAYLGLTRNHHATPLVLGLALIWALVPFLYAWFDPQGRTLHDRLAGTRLILLPKRNKRQA